MFRGLDDDVLKECVLATALGKSEEQKDRIIEELKRKHEEDRKLYEERFQIEIKSDGTTKMSELFPREVVQPTKSDDIVEDGEN